MPTYDYACPCGHRFEHFQTMSSKPLTICSACKQRTLKRLIGAGCGAIFKGAGFYCNDYPDVPRPKK